MSFARGVRLLPAWLLSEATRAPSLSSSSLRQLPRGLKDGGHLGLLAIAAEPSNSQVDTECC
jgi:hypothetical protein